MHQRSINICIIGAGEVVRERYSRGLRTQYNFNRFKVKNIYDICSEKEVEETLEKFPEAIYRRLPNVLSEAADLVIQEVHPNSVIIIATPTYLHIPYAFIFLEKFRLIAIEKPITNLKKEYDALKVISTRVNKQWFPLAYYLIEKSLPLLIFVKDTFCNQPYTSLIEPKVCIDEIRYLKSELGFPRRLVGCILEGCGSAGSLDNRSWVLSPEARGNIWETLFHLTCLITACFDNPVEDFKILMGCRGLVSDLSLTSYGRSTQDTASLINIAISGIPISIFSAKYLNSNSHQRWLKIEYERGNISIDFSSTTLMIETKKDILKFQLLDPTPYSTQFYLLQNMVDNPSLNLPRDVYDRALILNSEIYNSCSGSEVINYSRNVPAYELALQLGADEYLASLWREKFSIERI